MDTEVEVFDALGGASQELSQSGTDVDVRAPRLHRHVLNGGDGVSVQENVSLVNVTLVGSSPTMPEPNMFLCFLLIAVYVAPLVRLMCSRQTLREMTSSARTFKTPKRHNSNYESELQTFLDKAGTVENKEVNKHTGGVSLKSVETNGSYGKGGFANKNTKSTSSSSSSASSSTDEARVSFAESVGAGSTACSIAEVLSGQGEEASNGVFTLKAKRDDVGASLIPSIFPSATFVEEYPKSPKKQRRSRAASLVASCKRRVDALVECSPTASACVAWCVFLLLCYGYVRAFYPVLGLTARDKSASQHLEDIWGMMIRGLTVALIGNMEYRLVHSGQGLWFCTQILWYLHLYSIAYETCPRASIAQGHMESSYEGHLLNVLIQCFILYIFIAHVRLAKQNGTFFMVFYVGGFLAVLFYHVVAAFGFSSVRVHLHHYHWGWVMAHLCLFQAKLSEACQAMLLSYFIHGCAVFGIEPIFLLV